MLKTIKSLSEYEQLYNEYVTEGHVRGYLNYFISKKNISVYINEEKIKYAVYTAYRRNKKRATEFK